MQFVRQSATTFTPGQDKHSGVLSRAWSAYREGAAQRSVEKGTRDELSKLDDAALADIGVARSEIEWTASHLSDRRK
jgi:uncharacterized protein YjiS (DUF1127 family)